MDRALTPAAARAWDVASRRTLVSDTGRNPSGAGV